MCSTWLSSAGASLARGSIASTRAPRPPIAFVGHTRNLHRYHTESYTFQARQLDSPSLFTKRALLAPARHTCSVGRYTTLSMTNQSTTGAAVPKEGHQVVLVKNETPVPCTQTSGEFLSSAPRGAYTTGRTVDRNAIFEFEFHVQRLATSVKLMLEADGKSVPTSLLPVVEITTLRPQILASLRAAMRDYTAPGEIKLTVLITWDEEGGYDIFSHLVPLPALPRSPVKVMVKGAPRNNPAAKDTDWVRARKGLEDEKPADVNEIVLAAEGVHLFEGLSSNFYAVTKSGTVVTAGEGILAGTVRELLLRVCEKEGIPVLLSPPSLLDVHMWEGAMVSSTSRLATPIDKFLYSTEQGAQEVDFNDGALTHRIAALVQDAIKADSTVVFE